MLRLLVFVILGSAALSFSSCDEVNPPYINTIPVDTTTSTPQQRKVLIEDYTGHKCGNCPEATRNAYNLIKPAYGDRVIILAVHAGFFAGTSTAPFTYDFKCPEGIQLDADFGISAAGNPNGMVNRKKVNNNYIIAWGDWASQVSTILSDTTSSPVSIHIENVYNSATRELETSVHTEFVTSLSGNYNITVYLAEDSIINWQKDYQATPNDVQNYVHREAFRGSMNGAYGTALPSSAAGDTLTSVFTKTISTGWNENHMTVIAFVSDATTKEIIQVEQVEMIE